MEEKPAYNTLLYFMAGKSQTFKIMANNLVYLWADKLWHMNPPRKYIATRYQPYNFKKTEFRKVLNLLNKIAKCLFGNCFSSYCFGDIYTQIAI